MTKSTLIVRRSDTKHFGPYNCTVINSFGIDSVEITLLPDNYSRDYAPPSVPSDSLSGSLSRSTDGSYPGQGSLRRQASCGRLGGLIGPDVIPMSNPGVVITGAVDVRYAATYGNPYLRGSGPLCELQKQSIYNRYWGSSAHLSLSLLY
ncbi:putative nephrin, partial [Operophtera brumata]